ncbi:MAG: carboxypeptidase regulatory-like domain-containing protein [Terriglobales bacterium]
MTVLSSSRLHDRGGMCRLWIAIGLTACLLLVAFPSRSLAQEFRATLTGLVTDPTGAVVPKAKITATNVETGSTYTDVTTNAGVYYMPYVVPGTYKVKVEAQGFKTAIQDNVLLLAGKYFGQNFKLEVGSFHETMEVTAAPPLLETENASGGTILDEKTLQNVPVNGRQVYMMIGTTPGSQFTQTTFGPGGFSGTRGWDVNNQYIIGGGVNPADTSGGFNQFTLNGANVTEQTTYNAAGAGTWTIAPTLDSIQEVNVMDTTYDARFGRTSGGTVTVVTKNGTNTFHGEAIEGYKGGFMDANFLQNIFVSPGSDQQVENQFGGTFGGPIKRDKIWFFFSFEGYRQSIYSLVEGNVPPAYLRPGYNSNPGVDFGLVQSTYQQLNPNSPYALYGLTLFQPGDSNNPSNPNNAQCFANGPGTSPSGPANACGSTTLGYPNAYTGGTMQTSGQQGSLLPAAQLNPTASTMLQLGYVPLPNIGGAENYIGGFGDPYNYAAASPDVYSYNQPMIRVDYNTSDKTKWYSFFAWQKGYENRSTNGFSGLEANGNLDHSRETWTAMQDMTHTFSSTFMGDFKVSFNRFVDSAPDGNLNLAQSASKIDLNMPLPPTTVLKDYPEISGILSNTNTGNNTMFGNNLSVSATTNVMFDADFTKAKGAHNIHFGGGLGEFFFGNPGNAGNANGAFNFTGRWTQYDEANSLCYEPASLGFSPGAPACSASTRMVGGQPLPGYAPNGYGFADFLLGLPDNPGTGPNSHIDWNDSLFDYEPVWYLYAQDDWKVTHRLTINVGLRYDVQVGLKERYNELTRGVCLTCINPVTNDGVFQANVANSANQAAWQAVANVAQIKLPSLATVYGGAIYAGHNGQSRDAYNTDYSNIGPRLGFAFAINPKTVIRGGWGYFYSAGLEGGSPVGYQQSTPYISSLDSFNPQQGGVAPLSAPSAGPYGLGAPFPASAQYPIGLLPPVGANAGMLTDIGQGAQVFDFPQRKIPRTQQMSFGFQHEMPGSMVLDARWAANYASRLRAGITWLNGTLTYPELQYALNSPSDLSTLVPNPYYGVAAESSPGGCGTYPEVQAIALLLPYSQYCSGNGAALLGQYNLPVGRNWYNGMEVKLSKRATHGLEFNLAYTWSKNINGDGYQNGYPYQDANELHWISAYDRTNVLTVTGVYEVPVGKGKTFLGTAPRAVDYALGGWSLGWVFAAQSGTPIGIDNGDVTSYSCYDWENPNGRNVAHWINPAIQGCGTPLEHIGGTGYTYNIAQGYISQVRNPTVPNLDLSLQKSFKITERVSFSLRGEAFNALNSVLLAGPDTNVTHAPANLFFNTTTKHAYWQGFGTVAPIQQNFPRNLRITGKIIF